MHPIIAAGTRTEWLPAPRRRGFRGRRSPRPRRCCADRAPDVTFLTSPNNPTGQSIEPAELAALVDAAPGIVVVDEAYAEFSDRPSAITLLRDARAQADRQPDDEQGVRLRRAVGWATWPRRRPSSTRCSSSGCPTTCPSLTQAAARAALRHADATLGSVALLRAERERVVAALAAVGYDVVPSDANFVLFGRFADAPRAWRAFLDRGVLIRDVGIPHRLRVTIGTPEENDAFLQTAADVLVEESGMNRVGRVERVTKESKVLVEIDLDGTGQTDIATGVPFFDHMLDALGKHGAFDLTVQRRPGTSSSTRTTPSRTSRSCSARRCGRRSATSGASAASATRGSRWTRRSPTRSWTSPGGPYTVHTGEPEFMQAFVVGGHYPTVLNRHVFESLAFHGHLALHVRVLDGRDPHHITEAAVQGDRPGPARGDGARRADRAASRPPRAPCSRRPAPLPHVGAIVLF